MQEVIVQNFRAKPDTAMRDDDDLPLDDYLATIAVARLLLGPRMRVQAPPNLTDIAEVVLLLRAGVDDWGGVSPLTPDHVNPERPVAAPRRPRPADRRGRVRPARAAHRAPGVRAAAPTRGSTRGSAATSPRSPVRTASLCEGRNPVGVPWQEPDEYGDGYAAFAAANSGGRTDLHETVDTDGRTGDRRSDFDEVYGDWSAIGEHATDIAERAVAGSASYERLDSDVRAGLALAAEDPAALAHPDHADLALALMSCDGAALDALARIADDVRRDAVGDEVTYVVNRNINFTNVCYTGCRFCAFAQRRTDADAFTLSLDEVGDRVAEAWDVGATEICMQGGIHPDLPGTAYFDLAREVKRRAPDIHLHAFSPMEVVNGATRSGMSIREWLVAAKEAGLDSIPGTAAEILDDDVRWVLTKGKLPTAAWVDVVTTAHELGIPSTSTMMYGHVDNPAHWVGHLALLRQVQERTGGFTEFVALPFIHHNAPVYLAGVARPGSTRRDDRAVHAMARLMLHGAIDHIQCSWVKLGTEGVVTMLQGGCDDIGGTLMEETISRMAGSQHGSRKSVEELEALAAAAGRPSRQRTTGYGEVTSERHAAARRALLPLEPLVPR